MSVYKVVVKMANGNRCSHNTEADRGRLTGGELRQSRGLFSDRGNGVRNGFSFIEKDTEY